jgi:2-polyprenyl-3-methyl-5-hydroxy-6-metoxy-1,4-benzoquinol methylase
VTDVWSERAEGYRESEAHRSGRDLELFAEWAPGQTVLDVATGGGHVARRLREAGCTVVTCDPAPGMKADVLCHAEHLLFADEHFDVVTCWWPRTTATWRRWGDGASQRGSCS